MATHRISLLGWSQVPDTSSNVVYEPLAVAATNDAWLHDVWRFKDTSTRIGLHGSAWVPPNYNSSGTTSVVVVWSTTATSNNAIWDFDYRAVGGNDSESLDQSGTQESVSVTDAAPGAAWRRLECSAALTAGNLAAGDTLQFAIFRDGTDSDTIAADIFLFDIFLEYTD